MSRTYGASYIIGHTEMQAVPLGDQADFLEEMVNVLEGGWIQGSHGDGKGVCIEGAVNQILREQKAFYPDDFPSDPVTGQKFAPLACVTGFAAQTTLRDILGAELGMKKTLVEVAKHSAPWSEVEKMGVLGWEPTTNNPIPRFNDAPGQTQARIIQKLRDVIEEIRAGQGVFDGNAPIENLPVLVEDKVSTSL